MPALHPLTRLHLARLFFLVCLFGSSRRAAAQTAPAYEYLTVVQLEWNGKGNSKLLFIPAVDGKSELPLTDIASGFQQGSDQYQQTMAQHTLVAMAQLTALSASGWELLGTTATSFGAFASSTQYLLRRPRK